MTKHKSWGRVHKVVKKPPKGKKIEDDRIKDSIEFSLSCPSCGFFDPQGRPTCPNCGEEPDEVDIFKNLRNL